MSDYTFIAFEHFFKNTILKPGQNIPQLILPLYSYSEFPVIMDVH